MSAYLVFENVSKSFGAARAVDGVSLAIGRGEIFSLLGPSGCGKTTLLRMAAGFETPDSGRILLNGDDITQMPPNERPVNTVFQNYALFPHLSVQENIAFGPRIAGTPRKQRQADVEAMLKLVRLEEHALKKPAQLSGGQKQRVAIARALINKPKVLLLDEPLAALDLKLRQHMLMELMAIHREVGTTFIYVTHDQTEAIGLSDHIAVMNEGRIEQSGTPRDIYESPHTGFVAAFVGDTNFIKGHVIWCQGRSDSPLSAAKANEPVLCRIQAGPLGEITARVLSPLSEGTPVRVSVRPEAWTISAVTPPKQTGMNAVRARLDEVLYLGATSNVMLSVGAQRIVVHQTNRQGIDGSGIARGAEVWACFHHDDAVALA